MAYRAPNAYARFVRSASAVSNPGSSRIMALVGTGLNYYEIYNEVITKGSDKPYDTLAYSNVFEILSVTSKAVYYGKNTPDNVYYNQGEDFDLKDGQHIVWRTLSNDITEPKLVNVDGTDPFINEGSRNFSKFCSYVVNANNYYLVEDGQWMIEVTYAAKEGGCYRVINYDTKELIGEYAVSDKPVTVIPGVNLTVTSTFKAPADATPEDDENLISVGDYIIIKTEAGKTEVEAKAKIDTINSIAGLTNSVSAINVINDANVVDATYEIVLVKASTKEFQIRKVETVNGNTTRTIVYPVDGISTATWTADADIYDIVPGIEIVLKDLKYPIGSGSANDGDILTFVTSARVKDDTLPGEGDVYYVSYKYKKAESEYTAKLFSDYDDVVNEYGNYDVTASGFVLNSLSLGAEIAFTNGVSQIICVQAKGTSDLEMQAAIDQLKRVLPGVDNVNTIIPLTTSANVGAYAMKHVDLMSSYEMGKERMLYLGASLDQPITKSPTAKDRSLGMIETAKGYANERVVFVIPGEIIKDIRDLNNGRTNERRLPAVYAAVAVASLGLVNDPAEPLTNKQIAGFKYIPQTLMESEMNLLAASGCCVLQQKGSVIKVRHGITTSTTEVNSQEITLIQIKDYVIDACRKSTAALYIGQKNRASVLADVQYTITSILNQFISAEIIMSYSGLTVKRSKDDPRQIDVNFEIEAVYPLNYINITFGFSAVS